jgi:hypothetical protein
MNPAMNFFFPEHSIAKAIIKGIWGLNIAKARITPASQRLPRTATYRDAEIRNIRSKLSCPMQRQ